MAGRWVTGMVLLALAACDSPSPMMRGASEMRISRGGHDYAIYRLDTRVEVIRFGYAPRATQDALREVMLGLIAEVTGCHPDLRSLRGDSGEMRARLICPRNAPYPFVVR